VRYGKICILADADSYGRHIATLLCALFVRHFRLVVEAGHVHVAMPPLYRIDVGHEVFYALDGEEKQGLLDRIAAEKRKARPNVQRFKGLGEMNPLQLRETTMAPETRRLLQLTLASGDETDGILEMLLAKKKAPRAPPLAGDQGGPRGGGVAGCRDDRLARVHTRRVDTR
jgi:topoisomerase IV subunit B